MLKDKAQPIVVDELSGRIDEVDENQKEYAILLLAIANSENDRPG